MPRQRFNKLPPEKREQIMQTAGKEFAMYGYEKASLNRILETVGMSKGAAYYYFDDKADLFAAVLMHYAPLMTNITNINTGEFTKETFWDSFITIYSTPDVRIRDTPWLMGLFRAFTDLSSPIQEQETMQKFIEQIKSRFLALMKRGQVLGVVRTDISEELLFALIAGIDGTGDQWLSDHWENLTFEQIQETLRYFADAIRRVMSP